MLVRTCVEAGEGKSIRQTCTYVHTRVGPVLDVFGTRIAQLLLVSEMPVVISRLACATHNNTHACQRTCQVAHAQLRSRARHQRHVLLGIVPLRDCPRDCPAARSCHPPCVTLRARRSRRLKAQGSGARARLVTRLSHEVRDSTHLGKNRQRERE